ncbi:alpha-galactosidase [Geosmithia morbida]|uniref:Alpha-galactosidase n=1 Tax=Geosmithia morbida TaxID=1094350 RepID=A0A9P5CYL5_9HYPO|nr:alpha-galactosidase [Geosmithia morbida]KAF4120573.1 alpha-galactosidase [Geosmithia morbida]
MIISVRSRGLLGVAAFLPALAVAQSQESTGIQVDGKSFALNGDGVSYRFHVSDDDGDLISDHFGGAATEMISFPPLAEVHGWTEITGRERREFPDSGRGDYRTPAVQIRQGEGTPVSALRYKSHDIIKGKPELAGLPSTWGGEDDATTLVVNLEDKLSGVQAALSYSIFPKHDAVARSVNITNSGDGNVTIEKLASLSVDLPYEELDMINLHGEWAREAQRRRRPVDYGIQAFGSSTGYSSHLHNPFLAVVSADATESHGEAWGFSLIYTGSFSVEVEKSSHGFTRAMLGLNPSQLSWKLAPGETFTSPECVVVYSDQGVGGMSRKLHRLMNRNLIRPRWAKATRPILLNSWEGIGFDFNQTRVERLARETADLGVSMLVLDDGWFGDEYPRLADNAGLGDWVPNPERFPDGLTPVVDYVNSLDVADRDGQKLKFGLWVEPEMVNRNSTLYHEHPDWALHAGDYPRTEVRNQLVLNVGLVEVQDFIIETVSGILRNSTGISYIKWDNNRGMHEIPDSETYHRYMLGLYRVLGELVDRFPDILWEGCASGGGRFDPGMLRYFPQTWTSDNTDALDRLAIQFGTSLAYPPAAMAAHVSAVPNGNTARVIPMEFRGHVALMGASFGLELDPAEMSEEERSKVPGLIALAERIRPLVLEGDVYRLRLPEQSKWPGAVYVAENQESAVLYAFQTQGVVNMAGRAVFSLQGLDPSTRYRLDVFGGDEYGKNATYWGRTLMNVGLQFAFEGDYDSRVVVLNKV